MIVMRDAMTLFVSVTRPSRHRIASGVLKESQSASCNPERDSSNLWEGQHESFDTVTMELMCRRITYAVDRLSRLSSPSDNVFFPKLCSYLKALTTPKKFYVNENRVSQNQNLAVSLRLTILKRQKKQIQTFHRGKS